MEFAIVKKPGPRISEADLGVRGSVVGEVSRSGGAKLVSCRGVEGADGMLSVMDGVCSLTFRATGTRGCVQ